jgi:hypothetical protein
MTSRTTTAYGTGKVAEYFAEALADWVPDPADSSVDND